MTYPKSVKKILTLKWDEDILDFFQQILPIKLAALQFETLFKPVI